MMREGNITGTKLTVLEMRYKPLTVKESEFPRQLAFLRWGCFKGVTVFSNTEHIIKSKLWHENLRCGEILLKPAPPPTLLLSLVVEKSVLTWKNILYHVQLHAAQAGKQLPISIMPQAVDMVPVQKQKLVGGVVWMRYCSLCAFFLNTLWVFLCQTHHLRLNA